MSEYLSRVLECARRAPHSLAFSNAGGQSLTYAALDQQSAALARFLAVEDDRCNPVVVYGHKSPLMLVCFFACMRSGRAYVPIDIVYPEGRVRDIITQLGAPIVLNTMSSSLPALQEGARLVVSQSRLRDLAAEPVDSAEIEGLHAVRGSDIQYILFTSGSTGAPKGVQVSAANIDAFMPYAQQLSRLKAGQVSFNRAPFSFDMSVFDLVAGLSTGAQLFALDEASETSMKATFQALADASPQIITAGPSFIEMCLADPSFDARLLPRLATFKIIGELFRNATAAKLMERFPQARVINAYGPTESTDLVCAVALTPQMCAASDPLPVGTPRLGTYIWAADPETGERLAAGSVGELVIAGDTVAAGYFKRPDLTEAAFGSTVIDGETVRTYRTGDAGSVDRSGMVHFVNRLDNQVKLHGFRIELGDIERNLCALPQVAQACVVPVRRGGTIAHLAACIIPADAQAPRDFGQTKQLKAALEAELPAYMVPRSFLYLDEYPENVNGKTDRRKLAEMAGSR